MAKLLSSIWTGTQFFNANGDPLSGGKIFTYEAGSATVPLATYTDTTGTTQNTNPIILDSSGTITNEIFLDSLPYQFVLTSADGVVLRSVDSIYGTYVPGAAGAEASSVWVKITDPFSYASPTSLQINGNHIEEFAVGNRLWVNQSDGAVYATVRTVSVLNDLTTVTVVQDSGKTFDPSITELYWSSLTSTARAVDAGSVSYTAQLSYQTTNTLGNKIKSLDTDIATTNNKLNNIRKVWPATGTDISGVTTYSVTTDPATTSASIDSVLTIRFENASTGILGTAININGVGSVPLKTFASDGTLISVNITQNFVSDIAFNGTVWIVLDRLQQVSTVPPHGVRYFYENSSFVVPDNVFYIKVTCVGGGGGANYAKSVTSNGGVGTVTVTPVPGGGGACSTTHLTVVPGQIFVVQIGAGGLGATGTGPAGGGNTPGGTTSLNFDVAWAAGGGAGPGGLPIRPGAPGTTGTGFVNPGQEHLSGFLQGQTFGLGGYTVKTSFSPVCQPGNSGILIIEW